ncbi:hypothetical protein RO787_18025 [Blautia coccoides]|uniref:hypothetical protein n=1 Tax=Blautia producta TaxID=33035 RepID=UPI0028A3CDFE|nr:hypothetical protein [Blautia coccoides]MDT4375236.1 hypothetical protein [Blautia coccoides]
MAAKENLKYKNSVFVDLFFEDESAEKNEISLYNALHEEPLPAGTKVRKIRVEDVLYMNFCNDISFGIEDKVMVFGEHQSTINENMPLRDLLYIGRALEQIVPVRDRYRKKAVRLPTPEFYTFYNGKEPWSREKTLYLSDTYARKEEAPMLELCVKVININPEEGHEILDRCGILREYSEFVEILRKHQQTDSSDAYKNAIEECMKAGILADYLKKKGSEVVNMLIAEYDYDLDVEVQREEAYAAGKEEGRQEGREEGQKEKLQEQVKRKLEKGKSVDTIAEELEESREEISRIIKRL